MSEEFVRKEFEEWFLKLDPDYTQEYLVRRSRDDKYYFTSTRVMYEQFCTIKELEEKLEEDQ